MQSVSNFFILDELSEYGRFLKIFFCGTQVGDWALHFQSVAEMLPWYFAYDHRTYARYLPMYIYEILTVPDTYPLVAEHLTAGDFVLQQHKIIKMNYQKLLIIFSLT